MDINGNIKFLAADRDLDSEKDSLHILPLQIIPLETDALRTSRMLKNVQFDTMIEVFYDDDTGSGQVEPSKLSNMFDWPKGEKHPDGVMVAKLALLQSFDVYSLRMNLRNMDIEVEDIADLRLSDSKHRELDRYMRVFTRPLIDIINVECKDIVINDIGSLVSIFGNQNNVIALGNLKRLSVKLKVILEKLPIFLKDYGDVILSLAYFRECYDEIASKTEFFFEKLTELKRDKSLLYDPQIASVIEMVDEIAAELNDIMKAVGERFETVNKHTESMWKDLTPERFGDVKRLIESNHSTIGGVLCGLQIKMDGFYDQFYGKEVSNRKVSDYVVSYIKPGLDRIRSIERASHYANQR